MKTALEMEPSCPTCTRLSECQAVNLRMLVDLDSCAVFELAHRSVVKARADMTDLIGPWVLLRSPFPKRRLGEDMSRKPQTVRGALGEIGRKLGVLDTRKAFQMPAKAMAEALQEHVAEFGVNLEEIVAANDLDSLLEILEQIGDDGGEPVGKVEKKEEAPKRGRPAAKAEEEEEAPAPRRRGKPAAEEEEEEAPAARRGRRSAAPVEEKAKEPEPEEEPEEVPRRGRRGKPAEAEAEEEPAARRGRRGKVEEPAAEEPEEETPSAGRGRRGKPAETGTGDGGAAIAALIADLRKQVDGNSEAIQSLSKLNVEIDRILTQTETLGQAVAFLANDYFQLGKKDKIGNILNLDESLEDYINGGN